MTEQPMKTILRTALWQQFDAAIDMLENALVACPASLWRERLWNTPTPLPSWFPPEFSQFWHITYHTLFWLDLYLTGSREEEFTPPAPFIWTEMDPAVSPEQPYTKEELHAYLAAIRQKCHATLVTLTDERALQIVEYPWSEGKNISYLELQLYNMRHVQEHATQLNLFLGQNAVEEVSDWVGQAKAIFKQESERSMTQSLSRSRLLERLGHFPDRIPLTPDFGPPLDEGGYLRVHVSYMVEAEERISAWLLTPKGEAPSTGWPAMLAIHQHANQYDLGKAEPAGLAGNPMYAYGRELCKRGYVVMCPDLLCFEQRRPPEEVRRQNPSQNGAGYERFEFTRRLLNGSCLQTKYLHDLSCAVDLLTSLPTVNPERLGVIGHSLGGQQALWLTWYDARITTSVSSCGLGLLRTIIRDGIAHNFAMYVPGMLEVCDMDELVMQLAPRPFLLTAGENDPIFPLDGVRALAHQARRVYEQQGVPERFESLIFPSGHSFPDDVKVQAYAFLDRWLK